MLDEVLLVLLLCCEVDIDCRISCILAVVQCLFFLFSFFRRSSRRMFTFGCTNFSCCESHTYYVVAVAYRISPQDHIDFDWCTCCRGYPLEWLDGPETLSEGTSQLPHACHHSVCMVHYSIELLTAAIAACDCDCNLRLVIFLVSADLQLNCLQFDTRDLFYTWN